MFKSFASSFTMGGAAKRRKKRKEATRKHITDDVPESALPNEVRNTKEVPSQEKALEGISSLPRDSEITAAPSEDSLESVNGDMADGVALLDEVKPAPDEPTDEPSDLVFDVSFDGAVEDKEELSVQSKGIPSGEPVAPASKQIIQLPRKVYVIPVSQAIYGTVKNLWSFGTHIPILNLWMGLTHNIAEKVVAVVGQELDSVDNGIETKLAELDYHVSKVLGR